MQDRSALAVERGCVDLASKPQFQGFGLGEGKPGLGSSYRETLSAATLGRALTSLALSRNLFVAEHVPTWELRIWPNCAEVSEEVTLARKRWKRL